MANVEIAPEIVRTDLNGQVYNAIKERLLTREFGGGEKVSLQSLADQLGVSRSPVNNALTRLVSEGLVESSTRGFVVRPLTIEMMDEVHEVRLALELHAADLAIQRGPSPEQLADLRHKMELTVSPVDGQQIVDARTYIVANKEFHECHVSLAENAKLSEVYRGLCSHELMERMTIALNVSAAGPSSVEHERIVEAFETGDLQAARNALRKNVQTGKRTAREALEQAGGSL